MLKHQEKLYAFASKEAAVKFAFSPDSFISEVAETAKCFPELILLLRLQQLSRLYSEVGNLPHPAYCHSNGTQRWLTRSLLEFSFSNKQTFTYIIFPRDLKLCAAVWWCSNHGITHMILLLQTQSKEGLVVKPTIKSESSTQTELHPVEKNIVKSYEWNEWELRREALRLVSHVHFHFLSLIFKC